MMKLLPRIFIASCIVLTALTTTAQTVPLALETKLNNTLDSMQLVLNNKSLSASIQMSTTAVWSRAVGISSLVPYADVTTADVYEIGSVTKTLTAACVLSLVDDGTLNLNDSLFQWLDTINYINPDITIKQLLQHKSGLYDVLSNPAVQPAMLAKQDSIWDAAQFINNYIQPALAAPGGTWSYCNTNYFLLGMIIEQATGHPFYVEIRNRFITPLGLSTPSIPAYEAQPSPVAHVWLDITGDGITDDAHYFYYNWMSLNSAVAAAGGYYANAIDVTKWMRSYMRGDLHSPAIMAEAFTTVPAPGLPGATYGLGLMKKTFIGYTGYGHGGDLSYSSNSWYFPAKDISITVLNNDADFISWDLVPVVTALLKSYNQWAAATSVSEIDNAITQVTAYPNPFNSSVSISMNVQHPEDKLTLVLTNTLGEKISTIEKQYVSAGEQQFTFTDLENATAGMYFVTLYLNDTAAKTIKIIK